MKNIACKNKKISKIRMQSKYIIFLNKSTETEKSKSIIDT